MFNLRDQYRAFSEVAGLVDIGQRSRILVRGKDRGKFLNNFCTADIRKLAPGDGAEAFICNVKGMVLGHVFVYCGADWLAIDTVPGQAEILMPHFDRYILMDDVQLQDASGEWGHAVVGGKRAAPLLQKLVAEPLPARPLKFVEGEKRMIVNAGPFGASTFLVDFAINARDAVAELLVRGGAARCDPQIAEIVRIEAGVPMYGRDITSENLPQEVNRNAQAISFTKGCYLGQETVARIDALGHVNKLLVGLKFSGEAVPAPGTELTAGGKAVGHVTSAVFSPRLGAPLALGYVRTGHHEAGERMESPCGTAEVISLPLDGLELTLH